jgi:hypothetical protein
LDFKQICQWNREGWLWAPQETLEMFMLRKESFLSVEFPKRKELSSLLFDVQASEFCFLEENDSLLPWQGAVLWEYETQGIKYPVIQLRKHVPKLWKRLYTKKEMIEHELVHAVRFAYKEPFFEELLAYQTSSKKWRRFLGPLFIYPWEATLLFFASFGSLFFSLIQDSFLGLGVLIAISAIFFLRLLVLQALFTLCKNNLEKAGCAAEYSLAAMIRLSDKEILGIALRSCRNNCIYFEKERNRHTRISILVYLYFTKAKKNGCTFE